MDLRHRLSWCSLIIVVSVAVSLPAEEAALQPFRTLLEQSAFPENDEARRTLEAVIQAPAYPAVESTHQTIRQLVDDRLVQFEARKAALHWYLIFKNQRGQEPWETFPVWGRGTWIIKKDLLTGNFVQAKVFLQDEEGSFVRLFPAPAGRTRLDVHLYGQQLGDDVLLPVAFDELLMAPFARIASLSARSVDWRGIFPNPDSEGYRRVEEFLTNIQRFDDSIAEIHDAAIDDLGRNVFIESGQPVSVGSQTPQGTLLQIGDTGLNCSGYIKWIGDGLYASWLGSPADRFLSIEALRLPTGRSTKNSWSEARTALSQDARSSLEGLLRDPFFGLDWNRNVAYAIEEARLGQRLSAQDRTALEPGSLSGAPSQPDMGYTLDDLGTALYQLASDRPGTVYLAAVNSRFVPDSSGDDPQPLPLHQYWHVSILAPWFENGDDGERGAFRVAVMDTGKVGETLLPNPLYDDEPLFPSVIQEKATRYAKLGKASDGSPVMPEVMVHLIRVDVPSQFQPAPLPQAQ
ncbi:MAG: hypothetical protein MI717_06545 [Spirochaetales bacterium]|nr:hypothetical protein [Spirochaetales bacterium]